MIGKQNWNDKSINELNKQINRELNASLTYNLMSCYFRRLDIGILKLAEYFNKASLEERTHANQLMDYQTMRGGIVSNIQTVSLLISDFGLNNKNDIIKSFEIALKMEQTINNSLLELHKIAEETNDPHFSDYLEGNFLNEQVEAIAELARIISVLKTFGDNKYELIDYVNRTI